MTCIDNQLWTLIASGFLNTLLSYLVAVTDVDSRVRLIEEGAFHGVILHDFYKSMGYVLSQGYVGSLFAMIDNAQFAPQIAEPAIPWVTNASVTDSMLTADAAPEGYTILVYQWNYVRFNLIGTLSEQSQPGTGVYVLVNQSTNGDLGFPSLYLTIA